MEGALQPSDLPDPTAALERPPKPVILQHRKHRARRVSETPKAGSIQGVGADGQRSTELVKTTRHRLGARGSGGPRGRGCRRPNALIDRTWRAAGRLGSR